MACVLALVWDGLHDYVGEADVALVLGNTVHPDGRPSARLKARLDRTLELYRLGHFELIVVSGALGKEGHDEAVVMQQYLLKEGVPAKRVIVDSSGYTTYDSAKNTAALVEEKGFKKVLLVTQYFHIPRYRLALKRFGVEEVYTAHAYHFEWRDWYSTPRELLGLVKYAFKRY